tara:strand:+ start:299 stop:817 length:519 start_codon:yes stop_codon:yes gene_type:complete
MGDIKAIINKLDWFLNEIIMAGTFSQIYLQYVFAVKGRGNLLVTPWREEVFKYISGIIEGKKQKSIIVNGVSDHVHVLVGFRPSMSISDLIRDVKNNSSNFINKKNFVRGHFDWQDGYGVFSYSHSQIDKVYQYILNQEEHHKKVSFKDEYFSFLKKFEIEHEEKYLFDWIE